MLSKFSVKKPYTVIVAVIVVLILGVISFMNLRTDLLPSIDLPYAIIMTSYPGASPEEVEMIVTKPIEQSVSTVNNIKNVSSVSRENSSIVILEFNNDTNMDSATIEINGMLDLIKPAWDDYSISSPMVMRLNPDMLPVMISAVDVEGLDVVEVSDMVGEKIIPELESVNGVASVTGVGLLEEKIEVRIDSEKIEDLNKKILNTVDLELSEVGDQLMEAKKEIELGKSKLASEEKKQTEKLSEVEKAVAAGKEEIHLAESKISAGKLELVKTRNELETALSEINQKEQELKAAEGKLLALGESISEEDKVKLESIRQSLDLISQKKVKTSNGFETVSARIADIEKEESMLKSKKSELATKEQELKTGKLQMTMEMDKAKAQLNSGEQTLNEKMEEFEKAKDEAFKKASLDGVITTEMISGMLSAQNFSMPAGYTSDKGGTRYLVKVGDKIKNINEMKNLLLFDTGEDVIGKISLRDVADISMEDNSEDTYAKVNGNDAVMLVFQKQSTFLTSDISKDIREKAVELSSEYKGLSFTNLMDQGMYIDIVVKSVLKNIIYGGILAIIVLMFFLKDLKPTFIIAVSIPISIIFAIAMMYFTGVTINIISLAGLALGVGMLVDNSIVTIENIYRLRRKGKTSMEAAIEGAKEISGAITASTLTTACVFLPIVFVQGISRQLFIDMGLTIAYSLFASLIVALTLVPTMASSMLKSTNDKKYNTFEKFRNGYEKLLRSSLKHRGFVMFIVAILLGLSIFGGLSMGIAFIPEMDAPQMSMSIQMPKGAKIKDTRNMTDTVIERLIEIEEIETIGAFQSDSMNDFGGETNSDSMSLYLLLDEDKKISNDKIKRKIIELTDDLDCKIVVSANTMDISTLVGSGIEVVIKGREIDALQDIASDMANLLEETEGVAEVYDGKEENLTEIRIVVDKEKAMENGLTVAQVFSYINSIVGKDKTSTILSIGNKDYPVIVLDKRHEGMTKDDLEKLIIKDKKNEEIEISIGDIATITEAQGFSSIKRDSQERFMSVTADIDVDHNVGLVSRDFEKKLKDYKVPDGYKIELSGEREMIDDSLRDLTYMILLAIVLIYLIMVAQFQSLLSPFIILFTIPLAFTGGLLALIITGHEISLISMLGFLVLSGIVVNNGIVFVDYTNQLRKDGLDKTEALVLAGKTRMRPIMMTAITTILGLSTLSVGIGIGAEMLQPLAIVSIGGLTYATILTLFVVPVMYHLLNKDKRIGGN